MAKSFSDIQRWRYCKARAITEEAGWKINSAGVREKAGKEARLTLWYASGDSTRRDLAEAVRAMLQPLGIVVSLQSGSWETVERHMHANPTLFGWGSLDPMELFHHYSGKAAGVEYYNPGYYSNPAVEAHLKQAIDAPDWQRRFLSGSRLSGMESRARASVAMRHGHGCLIFSIPIWPTPVLIWEKARQKSTVAGRC